MSTTLEAFQPETTNTSFALPQVIKLRNPRDVTTFYGQNNFE